MDFTVLAFVLGSGVVAGSFGFAIGLGIRPGLKSRVSNFAHDLIAEEINNFLKELHDNPKFVSDLTDPIISQVSKTFGADPSPGRSKNMNILGFKIPQEIVTTGINMFLNRRQTRNVTPGLIDLVNPEG